MEVHHHPDVHHKRKKFKEYFLEFLMIFLAVTMGFFAEQIREYFADRSRSKEFIKEIVENLKYDSVRCISNSKSNITIARGLDSLRVELKKIEAHQTDANAAYYLSLRYLGRMGHAVFNTTTITELKNSGSMRLITNKKILEELADYYERKIVAANAHLLTESEKADLERIKKEFFSLQELDDYVLSFDKINETSYGTDYDFHKILERRPALKLLKNDPADLERLYTEVSRFEITVKTYNFWLGYCEKAAEKLIADIKNEYHLENE